MTDLHRPPFSPDAPLVYRARRFRFEIRRRQARLAALGLCVLFWLVAVTWAFAHPVTIILQAEGVELRRYIVESRPSAAPVFAPKPRQRPGRAV